MIPDFDELIGEEPEGGERERLEHVHELLLQAGPPPELPASLVRASVQELRPRSTARSRTVLLLLAATIAIVVFAVGYVAGRGHGNASAYAWTEPLHATASAPRGATGTISANKADSNGNWRMSVSVTGLKALPKGGYYVVLLVRHGKTVAPCGFFTVHGTATTQVQLNVPYPRTPADGWTIVAHKHEKPGRTLLTT
ncbi:MAG: anti-sigma factor domain-containing protein [Gaiellaceae bacterium]